MRTIIYSLALFYALLGHNINAQTTQEEYNYITKGYKVQAESGLDMKKGYSFIDYGEWGYNKGAEKRICTFKGLVRQGQSKPCAIMLIYKRTDIKNGTTYYICIPSANAPDEIWQQTMAFINSNFTGQDGLMKAVIWGLMKFNAQQATGSSK